MPKSKPGAPRKPRSSRKAAASKDAAKPKKRKKPAKPKLPPAEATAPDQPKQIGRPTLYSDAVAERIFMRLVAGESLRSICKDEDLPHRETVFGWLRQTDPPHPFSDQYARARALQAEMAADEILEIIDDARNDWMERLGRDGQPIGWIVNGEALARSRLRFDGRKWLATVLLPKRYGEKVAITGKDGAPLPPPIILPTMPPDEAARLYRDLLKAG